MNGTFRHKGPYFLIALAILALDQWSKWMVEAHLPLYHQIELIPGFFNLTHALNTGVAFGLFASADGSASPVLIAFTLLALGAVLLYLYLVPREDRRLLLAVSLVLGGAVGNLFDRLVAGAVTDFLDFYLGTRHWPAFNVADSAITVGIGLLVLDTLLHRPPPEEQAEPTEAVEATENSGA
jgi:signal peptidase II